MKKREYEMGIGIGTYIKLVVRGIFIPIAI
jgi:hypothetical protein